MTADRIKLRQVAMFREAARRGITRKMVQFDGGFSESTVRSWADGSHEMPISALERLAETGALPLDLLSMLLGDGFELVSAGAGELGHAALAGAAATFLGDFAAASHPASECGAAVGPRESSRLAARAASLRMATGGQA